MPDFGDSHAVPRLKQSRLPLARASEGLELLEDLKFTPSEWEQGSDFEINQVPPSWSIQVHDEQGNRTGVCEMGTPGEARAKKSHGLWKIEQAVR